MTKSLHVVSPALWSVAARAARGAAIALVVLATTGCWQEIVPLGTPRCGDGGCSCDDDDGDGVCNADDVCPGSDSTDTDDDGVCDGLDACAGDDRIDADFDGICDVNDRCSGADDRIDIDRDGTPDCVDRCRYDGDAGLPLLPLPSLEVGSRLVVTSVEFPDGSRIAHARPGETVTVRIGFEAGDCECPGCVWQVRIGLVSEDVPQVCASAGVPGCPGISESFTATLRMPTTPGEQGLRVDRTRDVVCSTRTWDAATRHADELGIICVE